MAAAGLGPVEDATDATAGADDLTARAEVVAVDGHRSLLVELDRPVEQEGDYLEVWLLRPDVSGMVSVGVLQGTTARLELPDDVSLEEYPSRHLRGASRRRPDARRPQRAPGRAVRRPRAHRPRRAGG
ncbi:anti-sigma factor domain-containing protein [Ornithinimicrobium sp. CNJ-824]|uniref:anti-sigma factor domain-containing protein n=1 Tax=Ornithinimicrobium sp. CNJ-824 TaxID=1904966 RepID=UPI00096AB9D3|nr:anti-sigma factor [Ornithinimicrobium sp. CNJ-824]